MRRVTIACIAGAAIVMAVVGRPSASYANPTSIWVSNLNVVNASGVAATCVSPSNCDVTTATDRAHLLLHFNAFQTQGGGRVDQEPSGFLGTPPDGFTYTLVQTNDSLTQVVLNGRGLGCTPACDNVVTTAPNATDHFVVYKIRDTGSWSVGAMLPATATQTSVALDSIMIVVVAPPPLVGGIATEPDAVPLPRSSRDRTVPLAFASAALMLVAAIGTGNWYVRRTRAA